MWLRWLLRAQQLYDLQPEVSQTNAWTAVSSLYVGFMVSQLRKSVHDLILEVNVMESEAALAVALTDTAVFVKPIVDAYLYEVSRHFNGAAQVGVVEVIL